MLIGNADKLIDLAIQEDVGTGDVTSLFFVDENLSASANLCSRQAGVLSGTQIATEIFRRIDPSLKIELFMKDGDVLYPNSVAMNISGKAQSILTAERTALNFIQRLSGVATLTSKYVSRIIHTKAKILDTRKTTPGYRLLEKQAVLDGGGCNHRMGLYDRAMVKDNHLMVNGDLERLKIGIENLKAQKPTIEIEVEVDTLEQLQRVLTLNHIDYILLDNMSPEKLKKAVEMRGENGPLLEASGGVNLDTVTKIAESGVDFISVGALTHSAPSLDLGLDFI